MSIVDIPFQGLIEGIEVPLCKFSEHDNQCKASTVTAYLGIPFAQAPIGPLRWKRPQKPAPSWKRQGVRRSEWKTDPMQDLAITEFFQKPRRNTYRDEEGSSTISEDCLYLNIWVPNREREVNQVGKTPVLVWVYGGSFVFGSTSQPSYDGARLCNETGCIVVSVTYRVGVFGFLGSRGLANQMENEGTGNYGAWDVIAGLEWIQERIEAFDGDASNVTVFGESAGSIILHYILISSKVPNDLFARAILESGTAMSVPPRTIPSAQATFDAIATRMEAPASATDAERLQIMYNASADDIMSVANSLPGRRPRTEYSVNESDGRPDKRMDHDQNQLNFQAQSLFGPVWDGVFVDTEFLNLVKSGLPPAEQLRNGKKGILLGYCADEGTVFNMAIQSTVSLHRHAEGFNASIFPLIKQLYGLGAVQTPEEAFSVCAAYSGDVLFQVPIRSMMLQLSKRKDLPAYGYIFAHRPTKNSVVESVKSKSAADFHEKFGAKHTAELAFVFGFDGSEQRVYERESYPGKDSTIHRNDNSGFTLEEQKLSLAMMRAFASFTRDEAPWTALNQIECNVEEDCHLLVFGRYATLGSNTPLSIAAAQNQDPAIPTREQRLGDNLTWTEKVGPVHALNAIGSQKEKQAFWSQDGFKNILIHYYGDDRITFLP